MQGERSGKLLASQLKWQQNNYISIIKDAQGKVYNGSDLINQFFTLWYNLCLKVAGKSFLFLIHGLTGVLIL